MLQLSVSKKGFTVDFPMGLGRKAGSLVARAYRIAYRNHWLSVEINKKGEVIKHTLPKE